VTDSDASAACRASGDAPLLLWHAATTIKSAKRST
jgi:hypothetical protein